MDKKAIIILANGFEDIEAVSVIDVLRRADIDITVAGLGGINIRGSRGVNIIADKEFCEINPDEIDALVLPGGMPGAKNLASSKDVIEFIKKMDSKKKIIAAICATPAVVLAPIGILDNRNATCYPEMHNEFGKDTRFIDEKVVVDGNLITSQGPGTAMEFAFTIVEKLIGNEAVKKLRKAMLA